MAGFLTNLGLAAGRNILYGQEFQERQAELDLRKQQVEMGKLALGNAQRQQQTQAEVGGFLQSEMQKDAANFTNPANAAKEYNRAAGLAFADGDFVTGNAMSDLAKGKESEARTELVEQQKRSQMAKDDLGDAAANYSDNPTPEGAKELVQKAIAAGVNPTTIPTDLQSPAGKRWVNGQEMASKSGRERLKFLSDLQEKRENRAEKQREFNIKEQDLQQNRQRIAILKEAMLGEKRNRPIQKLEVNGNIYERDESGAVKGDRDLNDPAWVKVGEKLTSQERTGRSRGAYAAAEIARSLGKVLQFDPGTTTGPFAGLGAHTGFEAVLKVGAQSLTPAQAQSMQVNAAGLGNQIASLEAALGGRMAAGTQQTHLQDMAVPIAGDAGYTALYKAANGKELAVTAINHLPGNFAKTEEGKALLKEFEQSVPFSTDDVIGWMKKDPKSTKAETEIRQLAKDSAIAKQNIQNASPNVGKVGLPGQGGGGGQVNLPPLPSGFTLDK